ncbi:MAG: ROK family protein [Clostridia bacterium]|nr:ROK family protein [Clostridia bacterium]
MTMILCLDIGGTAVKMGLCDRQGVIHARKEASVCFDQYRTPILETVLREAELFLAEQQCDVEGAGISATGQIDDKRGIVIGTNGRIPHWEGSHLAEEVSARFHVPAFALNDANAAALGESFAGRAKGLENVIMLTLGTGVGGGIILGGKLYSGSLGIAGELGHFTLYADGMTCTCGKKGCFECYASTTALIARAKEKAGSEDLNGKEIFRRAQAGDRAMLSVLDAWIDDIVHGITGLVHIFNPDMVLIGGGVSVQEQLLMQPLRERVKAGVMPRFAEHLSIERATLGNDAGMIGAARWYMERSAQLDY